MMNKYLNLSCFRVATLVTQNLITIFCSLFFIPLSHPKSGLRKTSLPNLNSLSKLPLLLERVWSQRPCREWVGPGVGKISAVTCLGGVSTLLGLILVPRPPLGIGRRGTGREG